METPIISVEVEVPFTTLKVYRTRQNIKTHRVPPYSTVYGLLESYVGEPDKFKYIGVELAIAMISNPRVDKILRKIRRFKSSDLNSDCNSTPEYQEILHGLHFIVCVRDNATGLVQRLSDSMRNPESINRFGCLCLGESRDRVNQFRTPREQYDGLKWLVEAKFGDYYLPHWIDHTDKASSIATHRTYTTVAGRKDDHGNFIIPDKAWVKIHP